MYVPYLLYPFLCQWTSRLLPCLGYAAMNTGCTTFLSLQTAMVNRIATSVNEDRIWLSTSTSLPLLTLVSTLRPGLQSRSDWRFSVQEGNGLNSRLSFWFGGRAWTRVQTSQPLSRSIFHHARWYPPPPRQVALWKMCVLGVSPVSTIYAKINLNKQVVFSRKARRLKEQL